MSGKKNISLGLAALAAGAGAVAIASKGRKAGAAKSREQHLLLLPKRNTVIPSLAGMTRTVKEFIIPMVTTRPLQDRRSPMA